MAARVSAPAVRALLAALALWLASAAAPSLAEPVRWSAAIDAGSEFDSNIHRCEAERDDCAIEAAPLARSTAQLVASWRPSADHRLTVNGVGATKLYGTVAGGDEDSAALVASGHYQVRIPARDALLFARASYHDRFALTIGTPPGQVEQRNFSLASAELGLEVVGDAGHGLTLYGAARRFRYKPQADFDWRGEQYGVRYRNTFWRGDGDDDDSDGDEAGFGPGEGDLGAALTLSGGYWIERREFSGAALRRRDDCPDEVSDDACLVTSSARRADLAHKAEIELVYTGARIYSGRYEIEAIDSNSAGPYSQWRHWIELGVTTELLFDVFATAEVGVQLVRYQQPLVISDQSMEAPMDDIDVDALTSVDDERRSAASVHLARDLTSALAIEGRYDFHLSGFDSQQRAFRRHRVYLGLVYRLSAADPGR